MELFSYEVFILKTGHFYFLKDQYFSTFSDPCLMQNKEEQNGQPHGRACYYAFQDPTTGLYWMIPFSSQVSKFKRIYNQKMKRHHRCDTIFFAYVLGYKKAFLIQNMCPVTEDYVNDEYFNHGKSVRLDEVAEAKLLAKAQRVLVLHRKGVKIIFPDVSAIESQLTQTTDNST